MSLTIINWVFKVVGMGNLLLDGTSDISTGTRYGCDRGSIIIVLVAGRRRGSVSTRLVMPYIPITQFKVNKRHFNILINDFENIACTHCLGFFFEKLLFFNVFFVIVVTLAPFFFFYIFFFNQVPSTTFFFVGPSFDV